MLEKTDTTEIWVEMTQQVLDDLDEARAKEKMGRSEMIMEATQQFLRQRKASDLRDEMERGYTEMASINFSIACECTHVESEAEDKNLQVLGG